MVEFSGGNGFHGCLTLCSTKCKVKERAIIFRKDPFFERIEAERRKTAEGSPFGKRKRVHFRITKFADLKFSNARFFVSDSVNFVHSVEKTSFDCARSRYQIRFAPSAENGSSGVMTGIRRWMDSAAINRSNGSECTRGSSPLRKITSASIGKRST